VKADPLIDAELVATLLAAAIAAGEVVLAVRDKGLSVETKADTSPVTEADRAAEAVILSRLAEAAPGIPAIAEEAVAAGKIPAAGRRFFLVDPLDGTKEFIRGGSDFTVNIGLIQDGVPIAGVVLAPATGTLYWGVAGEGAWAAKVVDGDIADARAIRVRPAHDRAIDVVASRSHRTPETDEFIGRFPVGELVAAGSSLKFCLVAAGEADLYPRLGTTMQWDTAAGDAVLRAAGGKVVTLSGDPLPYGPTDAAGARAFQNPWFIAAGGIAPIPG
jgi:3'(2'),5'-bisphosphate nucleotidase